MELFGRMELLVCGFGRFLDLFTVCGVALCVGLVSIVLLGLGDYGVVVWRDGMLVMSCGSLRCVVVLSLGCPRNYSVGSAFNGVTPFCFQCAPFRSQLEAFRN